MNSAPAVSDTPWDFRNRALVFGLIYGFGFFVGFNVQANVYRNVTPTYALLGARWGDAGVHSAAWVVALLAFAGWVIRVWGSSYLSSGIVWSDAVRTGALRVSGPYRYVRNPLYLGNVLLAVGIAMLGPPPAAVLVVMGNIIFVYRLISIEERSLLKAHGQAYENYRKTVPRLLPRLSPAALPGNEQGPSWGDGLRGEIFMAGFVAAVLYNAAWSWRAAEWRVLAPLFMLGLLVQLCVRPRRPA